jgi:hypothetical protein
MIWACDEADSITSVAVRSKNLKGSIVRSLKDSAQAIKEAVGDLALRSAGEENRLLLLENFFLKKELKSLREEIGDLKEKLRNQPAGGATIPGTSGKAGSPSVAEQKKKV